MLDGGLVYHCDGGDGVSQEGGGAASEVIMPSLTTNLIALVPATLLSTPNATNENDAFTMVQGDLSGVYWTPATTSAAAAVVSEDTITIGTDVYTIFPNAHRRERYSFFALKQS